jgi:cell division protein ZapE
VAHSVDSYEDLLSHLSKLHPSKYGLLLKGISKCVLLDAQILKDEFDALRFVAFIDRAYEAQVKIRSSGQPLTEIFPEKYLNGGYRKKYLRAISRLGALAE